MENKNSTFKQKFDNFLKNRGNLVVLIFFVIIASIFVKGFFSIKNFLTLCKQVSVPAITCLGMTFVLMTGGIDLSLGYNVGMCSYLFGYFAVLCGMNPWVSIFLTAICGSVVGLVNGALVKFANIPPFIATLGTGYVIYGGAQIISNGSVLQGMSPELLNISRGQFLGLAYNVYYAIIITIICYIILNKSRYGRNLSALGLNGEASRLSGINTAFTHIAAYVIDGFLTGIGACFMSMRVASASPVMGGSTYTFQAITAAILGGASLSGGVGSAVGSVIGVFIMIIIENCISLLGINYYFYQAVLSIVILLVMVFEKLKNRRLQ